MNPEFNDGEFELYYVVFDESEDKPDGNDFYVSGVQLEFDEWLNETTARYWAQVAPWAVTSFEQRCNERPDVISFEQRA